MDICIYGYIWMNICMLPWAKAQGPLGPWAWTMGPWENPYIYPYESKGRFPLCGIPSKTPYALLCPTLVNRIVELRRWDDSVHTVAILAQAYVTRVIPLPVKQTTSPVV